MSVHRPVCNMQRPATLLYKVLRKLSATSNATISAVKELDVSSTQPSNASNEKVPLLTTYATQAAAAEAAAQEAQVTLHEAMLQASKDAASKAAERAKLEGVSFEQAQVAWRQAGSLARRSIRMGALGEALAAAKAAHVEATAAVEQARSKVDTHY